MTAIKDDAHYLTDRRANSARRRSAALSLAVSFGLIFGGVPLAAQADEAAQDAGAPVATAAAPADPAPAPLAAVTEDPPPADPPPASDPPPTTTEPPVESTDPPVEPTDPPIEPTDPPVEPTDPPVDPGTGTPPPTTPPITPPATTPPPSTNPAPTTTSKGSSPASTSSGASDRLSATASARLAALAKAQATLRTAQTALADASAIYDMALERYDTVIESAKQLASLATSAEVVARESTRLFLLAARSADNGLGPLDALFGLTPGDELLNRLGTVQQLSQASEDPVAASTRAERDIVRAAALRERADEAQAAIADIPVASLKLDRDTAAAAVTKAQSAVNSLQVSATAASSLADLPPLPTDDGRLSGQAWVLPASGSITDPFGPRPSRPAGAGAFHYGTDIGSGCHAWIVAASAGTVVSAGSNGGLGNWILIDHGQGITTGYGHIEDGGIVISVGDAVVAGQAIALSGSTGMSTGCHVHIEVAIDGVRTDAVAFFAARGVRIG